MVAKPSLVAAPDGLPRPVRERRAAMKLVSGQGGDHDRWPAPTPAARRLRGLPSGLPHAVSPNETRSVARAEAIRARRATLGANPGKASSHRGRMPLAAPVGPLPSHPHVLAGIELPADLSSRGIAMDPSEGLTRAILKHEMQGRIDCARGSLPNVFDNDPNHDAAARHASHAARLERQILGPARPDRRRGASVGRVAPAPAAGQTKRGNRPDHHDPRHRAGHRPRSLSP